jgi:anti-sigma factor RsiW
MHMPDLTCAEVDDRDLESGYVAGRLTAEDAEAYEAHYFGCDRCWRALETALAVRSAHGARRRALSGVRALAVAATAVIAVAVGWWATRAPAPPIDTLRGGVEAPVVRIDVVPAGLALAWAPTTGADRYRIRVFSSDGGLLLEHLTTDTTVVLAPPPGAAFLDLTVLDALRDVVSASGLVPIAPR